MAMVVAATVTSCGHYCGNDASGCGSDDDEDSSLTYIHSTRKYPAYGKSKNATSTMMCLLNPKKN